MKKHLGNFYLINLLADLYSMLYLFSIFSIFNFNFSFSPHVVAHLYDILVNVIDMIKYSINVVLSN